MATIEEIKKAILKKVIFVTGYDLILKEEFEEQLSAITNNFITACEETKTILNWNFLDCFQEWKYDRDNRKRINDTLAQHYKRTNSWVEEWWWKINDKRELLPLEIYNLLSISESGKTNQVADRGYFWDITQNAERYIKQENLNDVIKYIINITNIPSWNSSAKIYNTDKSFPYLKDFKLRIYLISNRRIIKLVVDDRNLISSTENIIQKDLKKVEIIQGVNLYIHYHGLHDPDLLVMDSYELASDLRKTITELRELRFSETIKRK